MEKNIKAAIIDLYDGETNQGIRCIKDILFDNGLKYDLFDMRGKGENPTTDYDIYISSGGPGSPWDGEGKKWEEDYFKLMDALWANNQNPANRKKYVFFICHSFQIMVRYFSLGEVVRRNSKSFGIMPIHKTKSGKLEILFKNLSDPFYAADFREWQVIQPNLQKIDLLGAKIIALEKVRPHVDLERAIMAIRVSDEFFGTQFHPEADPESMLYHFMKPERKEHVVSKYGEERYNEMLNLCESDEGIKSTRKNVLPGFLKEAIKQLNKESI
ncbi:MAG: hypothetical protein M0P71_08640 [Melioribacteraceae bacterium]|nr:hypothetical protein [Melioribacteraceae bacterium]